MKQRGFARTTVLALMALLVLAGCKGGGAHKVATPANTTPLLPTATLNPAFAKSPTPTLAPGSSSQGLNYQPSHCQPTNVPVNAQSAPTNVYVGMRNGDILALNPANGSVRWHYSTGINNTPQIVTTSTSVIAVVGNTSSPANPAVFALDANAGTLLWRYSVDDTTSTTGDPGISLSGTTLYIGSFDGALHAISSVDKSQYWSASTNGTVISTPIVAGNSVFVGANDGAVYGFDTTTGNPLWRTQLPDTNYVTVATDGTVIYAADGPFVYALNASSGAACWRSPVPELHGSGTPIVAGKLIYASYTSATGPTGGVYALDPRNGAPVWTHSSTATPRLSMQAFAPEKLYASGVGQVMSFKLADGSPGWSYPTTAPTDGSTYVGVELAGGIVYAAHSDDNVYALDAGTGALKWKVAVPGPSTPGTIAIG